jgi:hypothetical protein
MSKFQFGKTKVAKTAESIRDDNEQGSAPLIPVTPDTDQQQKEQTEEQVKEQKPEESHPQVEERKPEVQKEQPKEEKPKEEKPEEEKPEVQAEQVKGEKPEAPVQPKDEPQQTRESSEPADTPPVPNKALAAIRDKSATNGIVVNVPMEDYFQLMMLKKIEKKTLKELALQAIHEFVERNRVM